MGGRNHIAEALTALIGICAGVVIGYAVWGIPPNPAPEPTPTEEVTASTPCPFLDKYFKLAGNGGTSYRIPYFEASCLKELAGSPPQSVNPLSARRYDWVMYRKVKILNFPESQPPELGNGKIGLYFGIREGGATSLVTLLPLPMVQAQEFYGRLRVGDDVDLLCPTGVSFTDCRLVLEVLD